MTSEPSLPEAFSPANVAVVTGAASGIGLAAAQRFASLGMKVVLADLPGETLDRAATLVASVSPGGTKHVLTVATDVSRPADLLELRDAAAARFGPVSVLMNNAGIGPNPGQPWQDSNGWKTIMDVNLWGVVHGVEAFVPAMLAHKGPAVVINTGSKQGITSPPGNGAYNMSKAALKNYTESLAHALRNECGDRIKAHLLIPGWTFTGMTARDPAATKPAGAWTADQVIDYMMKGLASGDFYILCPDNAVTREIDERRIQWAADDIILNRPALSRWHVDYEAAFARYVAGER